MKKQVSLSDKEYYYFMDLETAWRSKQNAISQKELLDAFPELVYDIAPIKILELEEQRAEVIKSIRRNLRWLRDSYSGSERGSMYIKLLIQDVEVKELENIERQLDFFKRIKAIERRVFNKHQSLNIEDALRYPIESLIQCEKLRKNSKGYSCCCPFHEDNTPSFFIYTKTNSYYCFGCCIGGNVINFVSSLYGLSYMDSVRHLTSM